MKNLYFENSYGEERVIARCETEADAFRAIHKFVDDCNANKPADKQFKIYYTRSWADEMGTHYDIGSHVEFFRLGD